MRKIMLNPKRILVTKFRAMGDTIILTAALKELHKNFPLAQIHVAATEPWIWLLEGVPGVTKLWPITWHNDRTARTKAATRLAFQLRKEQYDLVCGFHSSPAAAMVALTTGAKTRSIHFHGFKSKNMYSTVEVPGKGVMKPVVERDLDTVRALDLTIQPGVMPEIFLKAEEKSFAKEEFNAWRLKAPILGVALGASRPTKIWPLHRFAEVALKWIEETKGSALVIVGPGEEHLVEEFYKAIPASPEVRSSIIVMPPCNVRSLASRISQLDVMVGNDSGPRHLATALNIPTVTIFGPEHPLEWHPYPQDKHPRFFIEQPNRPDAEPGKPYWSAQYDSEIEAHQIMAKISTEEVFAQVKRVHSEFGKKPEKKD
jgi:ADP-heptose:LPS heptosyltransferase